MSKGFCLPAELADKLIDGAKNGEIDIAKMYVMTSAERNTLFQKWLDKKSAEKINASFEEAMISEQKTALRSWAKKVFSTDTTAGKAKAEGLEGTINRLSDLGVLTPANSETYLADLVSQSLGATVTAEEAKVIDEKSAKIRSFANQKNEFGLPTMEYLTAKKEMQDYLDSVHPSSRLKVITSLIGRGSMLFSIKSPLVNIESNTVQAILKGTDRRILNKTFKGDNADYAGGYVKYIVDAFNKTGYDLSRMTTLKSDQLVRGERFTTAQGKGFVRKVGRFYEDFVFKKLMGTPDVVMSAIHFADSANLISTVIAKAEGLNGDARKSRALEIFKDATKINPETKEGQKVRDIAIQDAEASTYTEKSKYSDFALGIRNALDSVSGDFMLGEQAMPFVKTPANVVGAGVDRSGVLIPVELGVRLVKALDNIRKGEAPTEATRKAFDGLLAKLITAGLGLTVAYLLSLLFKPEDFIGEYPTSKKEQELLELRKAGTNSIKIGDHWISMDYFGALGSPFVGMMYAKKYGKDPKGYVYNYYVGVARQLSKLGGLVDISNIYSSLTSTPFGDTATLAKNAEKSFIDYVSSRTIPALVSDVAKATDTKERVTSSDNLLSSVTSKIPVLREGLPVKRTVLGKEIPTEGFASTMLFGSRLSTSDSSPVIDELVRLDSVGKLPSITDYAKTSTAMLNLKKQIGEKAYYDAETYLGENLQTAFDREMKTGGYKSSDDDEKAKLLDNLKGDVLANTLLKFHYKKPKTGLK